MSYHRIQKVLAADNMFASRVTGKVDITPGTTAPKFVVDVYNYLKAGGQDMQAVPKMQVLAAAMQLASGTAAPPPPPPVPPDPAPRPAKKVAKPMIPKSTTKPLVVSTVRAGEPRLAVPASPLVDAEVIHRYQCAVASAQLLAALHQLFERDTFPGHEGRKKKLDELITDVEQMSSAHVNLSVKAIIRDQTQAH
jgi:hypothetical protein